MELVGCNGNCRLFADFPVRGAFQELGHEAGVQSMTGFIGHQAAQHRLTDKREVAEQIENLVTHKLVRKAKGCVVQDAIAGQNNGIFQRTTANQPAGLKLFHFMIETEGPAGAISLAKLFSSS